MLHSRPQGSVRASTSPASANTGSGRLAQDKPVCFPKRESALLLMRVLGAAGRPACGLAFLLFSDRASHPGSCAGRLSLHARLAWARRGRVGFPTGSLGAVSFGQVWFSVGFACPAWASDRGSCTAASVWRGPWAPAGAAVLDLPPGAPRALARAPPLRGRRLPACVRTCSVHALSGVPTQCTLVLWILAQAAGRQFPAEVLGGSIVVQRIE